MKLDVELPSSITSYTLDTTSSTQKDFNALKVTLKIVSDVVDGAKATFTIRTQIFDGFGLELDNYVLIVYLDEKVIMSLSPEVVAAMKTSS